MNTKFKFILCTSVGLISTILIANLVFFSKNLFKNKPNKYDDVAQHFRDLTVSSDQQEITIQIDEKILPNNILTLNVQETKKLLEYQNELTELSQIIPDYKELMVYQQLNLNSFTNKIPNKKDEYVYSLTVTKYLVVFLDAFKNAYLLFRQFFTIKNFFDFYFLDYESNPIINSINKIILDFNQTQHYVPKNFLTLFNQTNNLLVYKNKTLAMFKNQMSKFLIKIKTFFYVSYCNNRPFNLINNFKINMFKINLYVNSLKNWFVRYKYSWNLKNEDIRKFVSASDLCQIIQFDIKEVEIIEQIVIEYTFLDSSFDSSIINTVISKAVANANQFDIKEVEIINQFLNVLPQFISFFEKITNVNSGKLIVITKLNNLKLNCLIFSILFQIIDYFATLWIDDSNWIFFLLFSKLMASSAFISNIHVMLFKTFNPLSETVNQNNDYSVISYFEIFEIPALFLITDIILKYLLSLSPVNQNLNQNINVNFHHININRMDEMEKFLPIR